MKKPILTLTCMLIITLFSCENDVKKGTFTDSRDGKTYKTVKIGEQIWMAENLAYEILGKQITDKTTWANNSAWDAWCYYDNDKNAYGSKYGVLYQWEAARKACPTSWHLPSDEEWTELTDYLINNGYSYRDSGNETAKSMAVATGWATSDEAGDVGNNQTSNNSSGFSAFPSGCNLSFGFYAIGEYGMWWSSTELSRSFAHVRTLYYDRSCLVKSSIDKEDGFSIRCIKNN